ncbi:MAG: hypothetical protein ACLFQT_05615 [Thiohalophilus sp.]
MIKPQFFTPAQAVGIYVDAQGLTATQCAAAQPDRVQWREYQALEDGSASEPAGDFFQRVHRQVGRRYIPLSIALADPWVHQVMLEFDNLPGKTRERDSLIQWRLARDWQRDMQQYAISWQHLGEHAGRQWVVAQSIERQRLEPLVRQARAHGLMLSAIDAISNLLLNRLPAQDNTLLLHLQADYWSLSVTHDHGWPMYRRSTWERLPGPAQCEAFAAQLERMVVPVKPGRLERLVLVSATEPPPALCEALAARLGKAPDVLALPGVKHASRTPAERLAMQAVGSLCL